MSDLSATEQAHVKKALAFLRARCGGLRPLVKALRFSPRTIRAPASIAVAFRVARLASVPIDDVLSGKYPPAGTCAHCGHRAEDAVE